MKAITDFIKRDHAYRKGLIPLEWVVLAYLGITLLYVLFAYTKLPNPDSMIMSRVRLAATTLAMWVVYRIYPCKLTMGLRILMQGVMLIAWYPDTYEMNRILPNLDHVFANAEQVIFGSQPALYFASKFSSPVISELMHLGYFCYYPLILVTFLCYWLTKKGDYEKCGFIVISSFFIYYLIFDFLPVAGPIFYYKAVGIGNITNGIFPALGDYFNTHTDCLDGPGYAQGLFYKFVTMAQQAGERPTAAFPSSHVGVATICMIMLWKSPVRKSFFYVLPIYCFLCMSTVYIQAHYAIDALAGFITGFLFYYILVTAWNLFPKKTIRKRKR